jgi:hypothetical protein
VDTNRFNGFSSSSHYSVCIADSPDVTNFGKLLDARSLRIECGRLVVLPSPPHTPRTPTHSSLFQLSVLY